MTMYTPYFFLYASSDHITHRLELENDFTTYSYEWILLEQCTLYYRPVPQTGEDYEFSHRIAYVLIPNQLFYVIIYDLVDRADIFKSPRYKFSLFSVRKCGKLQILLKFYHNFYLLPHFLYSFFFSFNLFSLLFSFFSFFLISDSHSIFFSNFSIIRYRIFTLSIYSGASFISSTLL